MKPRCMVSLLTMAIFLGACGTASPQTGNQGVPASAALPTPQVLVTHAPDVETAVDTYSNAWMQENYSQMYALLDANSQSQVTEDVFTKFYKDTTDNLTLASLDVQIHPGTMSSTDASVPVTVTYHTNFFGDLTREITFNLAMTNGEWRVRWDYGLVMPELAGGNHLSLSLKPQTRGEILASDGTVLAQQSDAYALTIDPGTVTQYQAKRVVNVLSTLTGIFPKWISALLEEQNSGYIAVGETPADQIHSYYDILSNLAGVFYNAYSGRYYTEQGVAPHVTGYTQSVPAESLDEYLRKGYLATDLVGQTGLEAWGESYLRGSPETSLTVVDPQGQVISSLGQSSGKTAENITTTINYTLQQAAQYSLKNFTGAIVVLERDTGKVLAMASSPGYDPNLFQSGNMNTQYALSDTLDANTTPLLNRASQGGYPLGSVFKIVTMSAALESGLYTADQPTLPCEYTWTELPGVTLYDWTYEEEDVEPSGYWFPDGLLNLPQALMRSCNPWFYHIGLDLYRQKGAHEISNMAKGFGLGSLTGIEQIEESAGSMPDPESELDAVHLAIGQGKMLVTPLQVARFVAAVGNGGILYRPQVVEQIGAVNASPTYLFEPEIQGNLPVSAENLKIVQDAMFTVTHSTLGTAYYSFNTIREIPIYGKTGTAQSDQSTPHAWFAGYTNAEQKDKPDIAIAVLGEYAGQGSEIAAPIFRRMVEVYFYGSPRRVFPWESEYYVTETPSPTPETTPTP